MTKPCRYHHKANLQPIKYFLALTHIITKRLNDQELTNLRLNCEVFINLQDTDQLSGAMLETLCADKIVITGSWLNYDVLKNIMSTKSVILMIKKMMGANK